LEDSPLRIVEKEYFEVTVRVARVLGREVSARFEYHKSAVPADTPDKCFSDRAGDLANKGIGLGKG
jgi:hypothetical protein